VFNGDVWILRNEGGGTFAPGVLHSVRGILRSIAAGDLDGDQDLDLAVGDGVSEGVLVILNEGGGTFPTAVHYDVGFGPLALAAADLDGDHDLDLAGGSANTLWVLRNGGGATFEAPVFYRGGLERCVFGGPVGSSPLLEAGDLDGDQDLDLVTTGSVLLNDGSGAFAPPMRHTYRGCSVKLGDLDGDRDLDLAVAKDLLVDVRLNSSAPGTSLDCNLNSVPDECDIAAGTSADCNSNAIPDECDRFDPSLDKNQDGILDACQLTFLRGDCNSDGQVTGVVTDAVFLLTFNFLGGTRPGCLAACDANGDGQVTGVVTDAVYLLTYNFLGGPPPAAPFPACGPGELPRDDALGCELEPEACR
jgi:hypothetical protein